MLTNADATLYQKEIDLETRLAVWKRTEIHGVFWQNVQAVVSGDKSLQPAGYTSMYVTTVFIPFSALPENLELKAGNLLFHGIVPDEQPPASCLVVKTVSRQDFGSPNIRHWEVTGE